MYDGGLYWVSDLVITWGVGDIPHRTICSCWIFAVALSGNGEQNHQEILLAINRHRHSRRRVGHWIDVFDIKKTHRLHGVFFKSRNYYSTQMDAYVVALSDPTGI